MSDVRNVARTMSLSILIVLLLFTSSVLAQTQGHSINQVTVDNDINMNNYNITNAAYLVYNTGIVAGGVRGIPGSDIQSYAITSSLISSGAIGSNKLANPLGGPINVTGALNASYFYDYDNSNYYIDPSGSGTSLAVAGSAGIGTSYPVKKLDVVGDINATGSVCIAGVCQSSWPSGGGGGWVASGSYVYNDTAGVNVGIGTAGPESALQVSGTNIAGSATTQGIHMGLRNGNQAEMQFYGSVGTVIDFTDASGEDADWRLTANSGGFKIGATTAQIGGFTINSTTGNIGIGTTSPVSTLQISSRGHMFQESGGSVDLTNNLYNDGSWKYTTTNAGTIIQAGADGTAGVWTAPSGTAGTAATLTNRLFVTNAGSVGIGTTSPKAKLYVKGGDIGFQANSSRIMVQRPDENTGGANLINSSANWDINIGGTDGIGYMNPIRFFTAAGGPQMIIDGSGNVGIGTASPTDGKLVLDGGSAWIRSGYGQYFRPPTNDWDFHVASYGTQPNAKLGFYSATTELMTIQQSGGNVGIGTTSPGEKLEVVGNIAVSGTVDGVDVAGHASAPAPHSYKEITFTGNGAQNRPIAHGLGRVPIGAYVYDATDANWYVWVAPNGQMRASTDWSAAQTTGWDSTNVYVGVNSGGAWGNINGRSITLRVW